MKNNTKTLNEKNVWTLFYAAFILIALTIGLDYGYKLGVKATEQRQSEVVKATFSPISDCFVEFRINGKYDEWQISDFRLIQDEKNRHRNCEAEVAKVLKPFLEKNGLVIKEYQYEKTN